ncbi:centrobin isoform X2 [Pygocentrus nattereri]|uniref:centrobin isoform X2 n=1 Tax=Pygocentrus nattereri TaxID=42514 RepID=UPI0018918568|nr:centrobin isoform X2 [Pygocentrus nattereri]
MSVETADVLSDVEPLPVSSPASPSPPLFPLSSSFPSLTRSWPSSPLSSSRQVTARLYSSLQRSKEQELYSTGGYTARRPLVSTDHSAKARQVSFKPSSPELGSLAVATGSVPSDRLNESQQADLSLEADSSRDAASGAEETESEAELMTGEMDLKLQSSVNSSAKLSSGRRHIEEMENVRSHLQTMLRSVPTATDTDDLLRPASQHLQDDSYKSDTTSHLLSAALSLGGVEELFPRYSRLRAGVNPAPLPSVSELQVIRESLDRERARRKHSEQQVLVLQNKLLALQQQLALAVSADRKKDIMIEQLDKTLEKVVEGWRRHEQEKSEGVRRLQEEKEAAESARDKHREALASFEKSLSEAAEALDKEQKRSEELQNVNKQQERELAELRGCVEELRVRVEERRSEAEEERAKSEKLQTLAVTLQTELDQQNQQSRHSLSQLQQDITRLTQQLDTERERVGQEVQLREEAQSTVRQLQQELEETRRERDTARVDRALDQARFEAQRSQWEVELRLCVEQQVTERLANIQQENSTATAKLREQHRKQLLDLSARQERELSAQMEEFRVQLEEKDEKQQQLALHFNNKMAALQEEMVSMEASKRRLETQREELVSRLQGMMRSHWTEALRLLNNQEQADGMFSPMSLWDGSKPHSSPHDPDSSICSTANTLASAAPRAVVLHLSRERERGMKGEEEVRVERGRGESDFGLLDHSHVFCPLEPVLDDTDLTAVGGSNLTGLWDRPGGGEKQREAGRERTEREGGRTGIRGQAVEMGPTVRSHGESPGQALNQTSNHFRNQESYSDSDRIRSQFEQCVNRQANQNPDQSARLNQVHASSERLTSQSYSSEKGAGRCDVSVEKYSGAGMKAPPMKEQSLSIKERAPPTGTSGSSLGEDRQNELQYYISKLLDRSPGDPLEEQPVEQRKAETLPVNPGVNSQWDGFSSGPRALVNSLLTRAPAPPQAVNPPSSTHMPCGPQVTPSVLRGQPDPQLEQLAGLLRLALPQTPTDQQLQQLLGSLIRPEEPCTDPLRANLDRKLAQNEKRERQPPSRSAPSATSRGRRSGPQSHRSGSKVNVWR